MCGIVGLMDYGHRGLVKADYDNYFRQLLYCNALRGMHGTGIFAVDTEALVHRVKVGGPPQHLFNTKEYDDLESFISRNDVRFVVGHNRYATKGEKTTANAHPFRDQHIVLVHNGTLENEHMLPDSEKYKVDSEMLTHAIAKEGVENIIPDLLGAWTIVYWDGKEKALKILRNSERPLFIATPKADSKSTLIAFASEEPMLKWILDRNYGWGMEVEEVPADILFTFPLEKREPTQTPLKGKPVKKKWTYGGYFENGYQAASEACKTTEQADGDLPAKKKSAVSTAVVSNIGGDWSRGATGQVAKPKITKVKGNAGDYVPVPHLHTLSKDAFVRVDMQDYDKLGQHSDGKDLFQITCTNDEFPDVVFKVNVRGEDLLDSLIIAKYGIRGKIHTILKSQYPPAVLSHVVYLHDPEPQHMEEPEVPIHALQ